MPVSPPLFLISLEGLKKKTSWLYRKKNHKEMLYYNTHLRGERHLRLESLGDLPPVTRIVEAQTWSQCIRFQIIG